jgi:hypothetical protein
MAATWSPLPKSMSLPIYALPSHSPALRLGGRLASNWFPQRRRSSIAITTDLAHNPGHVLLGDVTQLPIAIKLRPVLDDKSFSTVTSDVPIGISRLSLLINMGCYRDWEAAAQNSR